MRVRHHFYYPGIGLALILATLLAGCSAINSLPGGSSSPGTRGATATPQTPTSTPSEATPTATTPPATSCDTQAMVSAEAWVSLTQNPQVLGSVNGGPVQQLSNFAYPLGLPEEGQFGSDSLAALAWSPDGQHLAVAVAVNIPQTQALYPYIVNISTHAATRVVLPSSALASVKLSANRIFAWADNHTLLIFGGFSGGMGGSGGTVSYSYDLTQNAVAPLLGVTTAAEGVVRGSTLFYLELTSLTQITGTPSFKGTARLHRYDLATYAEIGTPITLGETSTFNGAEGDVSSLGWDVSPDGSKLAYQQTSVGLSSTNFPVIASKFFAANADGTGAVPILAGATSDSSAFLAVSPDGQLVAVTNAQPTPTVVSGSITGGSAHYYQPDASGPPVWLGSAQFEAGGVVGASEGIERWAVNTGGGRSQGCSVHQNSDIPATRQ